MLMRDYRQLEWEQKNRRKMSYLKETEIKGYIAIVVERGGVCEEYFKYVFVYVLSLGGSREATCIVKPNASNSPSSHSSAIHTIGT